MRSLRRGEAPCSQAADIVVEDGEVRVEVNRSAHHRRQGHAVLELPPTSRVSDEGWVADGDTAPGKGGGADGGDSHRGAEGHVILCQVENLEVRGKACDDVGVLQAAGMAM